MDGNQVGAAVWATELLRKLVTRSQLQELLSVMPIDAFLEERQKIVWNLESLVAGVHLSDIHAPRAEDARPKVWPDTDLLGRIAERIGLMLLDTLGTALFINRNFIRLLTMLGTAPPCRMIEVATRWTGLVFTLLVSF